MESTIAVGLDIGTTKVSVVVGERDINGNIEIKGVGTAPSNGLRKGVVVNIDATVESIRKAVRSRAYGWTQHQRSLRWHLRQPH